MNKTIRYAVIFGVIAVLGGLFIWNAVTPGRYDNLAICLKDKGVMFYGAFWCQHCKAAKQMFGKSAKLLPYTECSEPDGDGQLPVCVEAGIEKYPTWVFPDGSRLTGDQTIQAIADQASCPIE